MSSDPKDRSQHPLTAERIEHCMTVAREVVEDGGVPWTETTQDICRIAVEQAATIDAQATEIAALRAVSSQQQQRAQLAEERVAALKGALEEDLCPWHRGGEGMRPYSWDEPCGTKAFLIVKPCERVRRVLAGKEAQGEQRLRENKLNTAPRKSGYITQKWDGLSRPEFHGRTEEAQGD